jgi:ParB/RepB/Spo0J family partition protein
MPYILPVTPRAEAQERALTDTRRIPLAAIRPNPDQPRKTFHKTELEDLAASLRSKGLLQPITVRPIGDGFEIVAGERRFRAAGLLGWDAIDANVREMTDDERDVFAIVENLQRADVEPMEEARAFKRLADKGRSAEEIASAVGLPVFRVRWRLQLLNLTSEVSTLVEGGHLDRQQALEVARVPKAHQIRMVQMINAGQLQGWKAVRSAADAIIGGKTQADIFGDAAPVANDDDVAAVRGMERKIESVAAMVGKGWRDGECIVATKVSPDRATKMADTIAAIQSALRIMERELRNTAAQAVAVLPMAAE